MDEHLFAVAAAALAIERISYIGISRRPELFVRLLVDLRVLEAVPPIDVVRSLFVGFKLLQGAVFVQWLVVHGGPSFILELRSPAAAALGVLLVAIGQWLNVSVFLRLGSDGVFYGTWFGKSIEWSNEFPFSIVAHPQYLGASLSIWGFFLLTRYPYPDWVALPLLESAYYAVGARLER